MWTCKKCGRIFEKENQMHSCKEIPVEKHFENKPLSKELFNYLVEEIKDKIGKVQIISLPCCIHLFGTYDFIAILPRKDRLELRFALNRRTDNQRIDRIVPLSSTSFKHRLFISSKEEIDKELMDWLRESYEGKDV